MKDNGPYGCSIIIPMHHNAMFFLLVNSSLNSSGGTGAHEQMSEKLNPDTMESLFLHNYK